MPTYPRRPVRYLAALFGAAFLIAAALTHWPAEQGAASTVSFREGTLKGFIEHPTSITFGPDGRLYVANGTELQALTLDAAGTQVTAVEPIASGLDNALGVAFDPTTLSPVTVYISRQNTAATDGFEGVISKYTAPYWNRVDVITGLPTSQPLQNHMTNGIAFDSAGKLYIAQGSATNSGLSDPSGPELYWPETPLSAAILVTDIHVAGFDGAITYSPAGPPASDAVDQTGGDVQVFAAGLRNPYDLVLHSSGHIYATDNGPFASATSLTCVTEGGRAADSDELNRIAQASYYGFPNRNRGRGDSRQCTYHAPTEATTADFTAPILTLNAHCSCDGIAEYTSGAFDGKMRGNLLIAQFGTGNIRRIILTDADTVGSSSFIGFDFEEPLDIAVGPSGIIYIAEFGGNDIAYLQPTTPAATSTPVTPTTPDPSATATASPTPATPFTTATPTVPPATATRMSTPTPAGPTGDANCDGVANAIDAALVLQRSAGLISALPCQANADVNGDGLVDAIDAALILQYVAGLLSSLPP